MFSVRKIWSFILAFVLLIIGSILEGIVPKEIGRGIDSIQSVYQYIVHLAVFYC